MKKLLVFMMALVMTLSLAACGGVPEAKLGEADALLSKVEVLVEDAEKELEKTNNTGYEDVQSYYDTNVKVMEELNGIIADTKAAWAENKDGIDEETVDKFITELKNLETQAQNLKKNAVDEVAAIGTAIEETEVAAEVITVPVEIINNTGVEIHALAMSPTNSEDWGENLLTATLAADQSGVTEMSFTQDTLVWDLLVQDADGNQLSFMGIDFSQANIEGAQLVLAATEGGDYMAMFTE